MAPQVIDCDLMVNNDLAVDDALVVSGLLLAVTVIIDDSYCGH